MISDTMTAAAATATDHQWIQQFYQQQALMDLQVPPTSTEGSFSNSISTVVSAMSSDQSPISSYNTSSHTTIASNSGHLTPKANVSKPIRRRSRASKKTPTTLLNANTSNFRALVQQFTGCPPTSTMSIGVHKGPITLNFQQGSQQQQQNIHHNTSTSRLMMPPFGARSGYNQVAVQLPWQKQQSEQELLQEQQISGNYSIDHVMKSSNFLPITSSGNYSRPTSMEDSDHHGLLNMDNNFSLNELTLNNAAFSNGADIY